MKRLIGYFLNGLIFSAPVALTIYVVWTIFTTVDGWLRLSIPGVGFVATLALITLVGFIASNFLARRMLDWVEALLEKLPGIRLLYSSMKDVFGAFVGEKKRFQQPVLVTIDPVVGSKAIGFLTQDSVDELGIADHVTVYLPFSYSIAGQLMLFPRDRITRLNAPSAKVMAYVVSGGVAVAAEVKATE
ncbi:MAG: DUF502 domain-containing protein [Gemmatimonadales bacterium]